MSIASILLSVFLFIVFLGFIFLIWKAEQKETNHNHQKETSQKEKNNDTSNINHQTKERFCAMLTFETGRICSFSEPNTIFINGKKFEVNVNNMEEEIERIKREV